MEVLAEKAQLVPWSGTGRRSSNVYHYTKHARAIRCSHVVGCIHAEDSDEEETPPWQMSVVIHLIWRRNELCRGQVPWENGSRTQRKETSIYGHRLNVGVELAIRIWQSS